MIRATTNGVLKSYRYQLNQSTLRLNSSRDTVLTQRNFNSYAEDPSAAAESFQLRRTFMNVSTQLDISESTSRKFDTAYSALDSVVSMVDNAEEGSALRAIFAAATDTTGSGRTALGTELIQLADSIVQSLNCKYGDQYLFSGADGLTIPFTWKGEGADRKLYYRGNGVSDPAKKDTLDYISDNESRFVDIGIGLSEDENGNLIHSSAFNSIFQGIGALGYDTTDDGTTRNIAEIIYQMGYILSQCDEESGAWDSTKDTMDANGNVTGNTDQEKFKKLMEQFSLSSSELKKYHVEMSTKANYLKNNQSVLEDTAYTLNEQILAVDQCDLADAITSFSWAQYCYNAALKMGNSLLSESLMDYMS